MPTFDPTVAAPSPTAGAAVDQQMADQVAQGTNARVQAKVQQGFLTNDYQKYEIPQLKSSIGATGQFYSTARNTQEGQAATNFLHNSYDIQAGLNQSLDELTRSRMQAALGLVI